MKCECYDEKRERCNGTKEQDLCSCNGDKKNCSFYDYVRKEAVEKEMYEQRLIDANSLKRRVLPKCKFPESFEAEVDKEPTVDVPKVVHAYWQSSYVQSRFCSKCGHNEPYKFASTDTDVYYYCPHCGAKMDGKREENVDGKSSIVRICKWTSVRDELPKESGCYLVNVRTETDVDRNDIVLNAWFNADAIKLFGVEQDVGWHLLNEFYNLSDQLRGNITHWMPIPKEVTVEEDDS